MNTSRYETKEQMSLRTRERIDAILILCRVVSGQQKTEGESEQRDVDPLRRLAINCT